MASIQNTGKRRTWGTVVLWTVQILLGVFFVVASGTPKLFGQSMAVQMFDTIGFGDWFRYLAGICEVAGGIGLLIPRLSGLAACGLAGVMIGATLTNLFLLPGMAPTAIETVVFGLIFVLIAYARRDQTRALVAPLRR